MKEIKFMKRSLENEGAHPLFKGASTHYFRGLEHPSFQGGASTHYLRGLEHSLFEEQLNREQMNAHE